MLRLSRALALAFRGQPGYAGPMIQYRTLALFGLLSAVGVAGASSNGCKAGAGSQPAVCAAYLTCLAELNPDEVGTLVSAYGQDGTCWTQPAETIAVCTEACKNGLSNASNLPGDLSACQQAGFGGSVGDGGFGGAVTGFGGSGGGSSLCTNPDEPCGDDSECCSDTCDTSSGTCL